MEQLHDWTGEKLNSFTVFLQTCQKATPLLLQYKRLAEDCEFFVSLNLKVNFDRLFMLQNDGFNSSLEIQLTF